MIDNYSKQRKVIIFVLQTNSMKLIADSGSTKTTWALLHEGEAISVFNTSGFNPYYFGSSDLGKILRQELPDSLPKAEVSEIVFYGSGCSTMKNCNIVSEALSSYFTDAAITIHHDLLAAAHALLGHDAGIACILGTGSNSCLYDGQKIVAQVPSLGYLLGDEGSGYHIGRRMLAAILNGSAPAELIEVFNNQYRVSLADVLHRIYREEKPGPFIASFTEFVAQQIEHPWCNQLVMRCFEDFFALMPAYYPSYRSLPFSFTGSVAYHFRQQLLNFMVSKGLKAGRILSAPIEGLIEFHR